MANHDITIRINAQNNASSALAGVNSQLTQLNSTVGGSVLGVLNRMNTTMNNMARSLNTVASATVRANTQLASLGTTARRTSTSVSSIQNSTNNLTSIISSLGGGMNGLLSTISNLHPALKGVVGVLTAVAGACVVGKSAFIDYNAEMERTQVAFTSLLKSSGQAQAMMQELHRLAANTPFEFPGLAKSGQRLVSFGYSAREAVDALKNITDAVASTGGTQAEIDRVSLAIGQMSMKAKASAEEVNQLIDAGVNVKGILQKQLGLTADQVGDLGNQNLEGRKVADAILKGMGEEFAGGAKAQSKTFTGMISTIVDDTNYVLGELGKPVFDKVKSYIEPVWEYVGNLVNKINEIGIGATIKEMIGEDTFNELVTTFAPIISFFKSATDSTKALFKSLGEVLLTFYKWQQAVMDVRQVFVALGATANTWNNLVAGAETFYWLLCEMRTSALEPLKQFLEEDIENTSKRFEKLKESFDKIKEDIASVWDAIANEAEYAFNSISEIINNVVNTFNTISDGVDETITYLQNIFDEGWNYIAEIASNAWDYISNIFSNAYNYIDGITGGWLSSFVSMCGSAFGGLYSTLNSIWDSISTSILNKVRNFVNNILSMINELSSMLGGVLAPIGSSLASAIEGADAKITELTKNISNHFNESVKKIEEETKKVQDWAKTHKGETLSNKRSAPSNTSSPTKKDTKGSSGADKAQKEYDKASENIKKLWKKLTDAISKETDNAYTYGIKKLEEEVEDYKKKIAEAQAVGVDTTALEDTMVQWYRVMKNSLLDKANKAFDELRLNFNKLKATATGNWSLAITTNLEDKYKEIANTVKDFIKNASTDDVNHNNAVKKYANEWEELQKLEAYSETVKNTIDQINNETKILNTSITATLATNVISVEEANAKIANNNLHSLKLMLGATQQYKSDIDEETRQLGILNQQFSDSISNLRQMSSLYDENSKEVEKATEQYREVNKQRELQFAKVNSLKLAYSELRTVLQGVIADIGKLDANMLPEIQKIIDAIGKMRMDKNVFEDITMPKNISEANPAWVNNMNKGISDALNQLGTFEQACQQMGADIVAGFQSAFSTLFSDMLMGELKSIGEYAKSLAQSISKAFSEMFSKMAVQSMFRYFGFESGGLVTKNRTVESVLPHYATGGSFVAGENGPEIISLLGGNRASVTSTHTSQRKLNNEKQDIQINVYNETGQQMDVGNTKTSFDGEKMIISMWMQGVNNNIMGVQNMLRSMA